MSEILGYVKNNESAKDLYWSNVRESIMRIVVTLLHIFSIEGVSNDVQISKECILVELNHNGDFIDRLIFIYPNTPNEWWNWQEVQPIQW
jgi:hypothetical protein